MTKRSASLPFDVEHLGAATVPWTNSYRLKSSSIDQDFLIQVAWPPVPAAPDQKFAVVYVLDGNHAFTIAAQVARALQSGPFPMPPTLVVGIGYHFETLEDRARWSILRVRDFTPCTDALFESQYSVGPGAYGGAAAFLTFIETEVKPFVASRFPVDPDDQTLTGASLGGLFALYTLFTAPGAFKRYVAISPALYWGERTLFALEAELADRAKDLPVQLYLAAGGLEEAHDARQKFVSNLYEMEAKLRARDYPGLEMSLRVFEGETHMSVYFGALARGLGAVFGGYRDMHDWSRWLQRA
jgi:predicted alpha/beta superfamily hydrolase